MKLQRECLDCVTKIVDQMARDHAGDPRTEKRLADIRRSIFNRWFRPHECPPWLTTQVLKAAFKATGVFDPYRRVRYGEMAAAERIVERIRPFYGDDFRSCVELAVLGNSLDFHRDARDLEAAAGAHGGKRLSLPIDHVARAESMLRSRPGGMVLYLADNAGETFFDMPLIEKLTDMGLRPVYAVKERPFVNDLILHDIELVARVSRVAHVLSTGGGAILDLARLSPEFRDAVKNCALIISKGQANYECMSEFSLEKPVFYLLKAKCQPISEALRVDQERYVAMLSESR